MFPKVAQNSASIIDNRFRNEPSVFVPKLYFFLRSYAEPVTANTAVDPGAILPATDGTLVALVFLSRRNNAIERHVMPEQRARNGA